MKLMKRNFFLSLIAISIIALLSACSDKRAVGASSDVDSTLTAEYVSKISLQEPERALALIDTMEMKKTKTPFVINFLRSAVYLNGLTDDKMAYYYGQQAMKDSINMQKDVKHHYSILRMLAGIANSTDQYSQSIKIDAEVYLDRKYKNNGSRFTIKIKANSL